MSEYSRPYPGRGFKTAQEDLEEQFYRQDFCNYGFGTRDAREFLLTETRIGFFDVCCQSGLSNLFDCLAAEIPAPIDQDHFVLFDQDNLHQYEFPHEVVVIAAEPDPDNRVLLTIMPSGELDRQIQTTQLRMSLQMQRMLHSGEFEGLLAQ